MKDKCLIDFDDYCDGRTAQNNAYLSTKLTFGRKTVMLHMWNEGTPTVFFKQVVKFTSFHCTHWFLSIVAHEENDTDVLFYKYNSKLPCKYDAFMDKMYM